MSFDQIISHIQLFAKPDQNELNQFVDALQPVQVKQKEIILKSGQYAKHLYFIHQGCFRSFYVNNKGVEKILNFGIENWWITDFDSFLKAKPTRLNIQALEEAELLSITKNRLDEILNTSLEFNKYFRTLQEIVRISDQRRMQYMFDLSGEELYDRFCQANPDFLQRIPQYMLASYLDMTPEFLSKIRKRKAENRS